MYLTTSFVEPSAATVPLRTLLSASNVKPVFVSGVTDTGESVVPAFFSIVGSPYAPVVSIMYVSIV